jgi:hypothetical protein
MTELSLAAAALLVAAAISEFVLHGTKLQTGLARVLIVWIAVYVSAIAWFGRHATVGPIAFSVFWGGAFLVWFGVRSHLESSILLRMLVLLRKGAMTDLRVVEKYVAVYGESMRVAELSRGGLVAGNRDDIRVTPKGKVILTLASRLR